MQVTDYLLENSTASKASKANLNCALHCVFKMSSASACIDHFLQTSSTHCFRFRMFAKMGHHGADVDVTILSYGSNCKLHALNDPCFLYEVADQVTSRQHSTLKR